MLIIEYKNKNKSMQKVHKFNVTSLYKCQTTFVFYDTNISLSFAIPMHMCRRNKDGQTDGHYWLFQMLFCYRRHA